MLAFVPALLPCYHPTLRPTPAHTRARAHARTCARALVRVCADTGARARACAHACGRACTNCVRAHFRTSAHARTCACGPVHIDAALVPVFVPALMPVTVALSTCFFSFHGPPFVRVHSPAPTPIRFHGHSFAFARTRSPVLAIVHPGIVYMESFTYSRLPWIGCHHLTDLFLQATGCGPFAAIDNMGTCARSPACPVSLGTLFGIGPIFAIWPPEMGVFQVLRVIFQKVQSSESL